MKVNMKHKVQPWVRNIFKKNTYALKLTEKFKNNSIKLTKWSLWFHVAPVTLFSISLFTGAESSINYFLMGYVCNVMLFALLTIGFYMFDLDWND